MSRCDKLVFIETSPLPPQVDSPLKVQNRFFKKGCGFLKMRLELGHLSESYYPLRERWDPNHQEKGKFFVAETIVLEEWQGSSINPNQRFSPVQNKLTQNMELS